MVLPLRTRRTKIVCTIGPASRTPERLRQLIDAGMDVARLNFSHGTHEEHAAVIATIRRLAQEAGRPVGILQDLQGPKIRTGALADGQPVTLVAGRHITVTTRQIPGTATQISTIYTDLPNDVKAGDRILISDGLIALRVLSVQSPDIVCEIINGGVLREHQGINLPGVAVSAPALTDKDRADLDFGVAQGVDFIALSFVRRASDLEIAHQAIASAQARHGKTQLPIPLIAKIEKPDAVASLDDVLKAADGVMVARGDLGVELPLEQVPLIQKQIIKRANELEIPVITATQMLESMITNPRPTRAEVSDVANAILDGTDAIMLSGETAMGSYPIEAVRMMVSIAVEMDGKRPSDPLGVDGTMVTTAQAISNAAATLANQARARFIVVFTRSGVSAHLISKDRPNVPIIAMTPDTAVYNRLTLYWGVVPYQTDLFDSSDQLVNFVDHFMTQQGLMQPGEPLVIMGGMPVARRARTNFIKLHRIGEI